MALSLEDMPSEMLEMICNACVEPPIELLRINRTIRKIALRELFRNYRENDNFWLLYLALEHPDHARDVTKLFVPYPPAEEVRWVRDRPIRTPNTGSVKAAIERLEVDSTLKEPWKEQLCHKDYRLRYDAILALYLVSFPNLHKLDMFWPSNGYGAIVERLLKTEKVQCLTTLQNLVLTSYTSGEPDHPLNHFKCPNLRTISLSELHLDPLCGPGPFCSRKIETIELVGTKPDKLVLEELIKQSTSLKAFKMDFRSKGSPSPQEVIQFLLLQRETLNLLSLLHNIVDTSKTSHVIKSLRDLSELKTLEVSHYFLKHKRLGDVLPNSIQSVIVQDEGVPISFLEEFLPRVVDFPNLTTLTVPHGTVDLERDKRLLSCFAEVKVHVVIGTVCPWQSMSIYAA